MPGSASTSLAGLRGLSALFLLVAVMAWATRSDLGGVYAGFGRPQPDPAPPRAPARALATIHALPGFAVTLAAAEPMVEAPIAGQFDEDGRLWLVEMPSYMRDLDATTEKAPTGRIVVLEDPDGNGTFDKRTIFLDHLVLARGVAPCYGGALVLEPPNLYFCKDTDGDGRADTKKLLLTGVGVGENPEHEGNGLIRGLDNWYHLSQDRIEFRFDGEKVQTRPTPVHGQWGLGMDDFGRLYYTPNSNPLLTDLYPKHYASRNPAMAGAPGIGEDIDKDTSTWPSHPTRGVNRGYQPDVLRPDGTLASLTAACGTLVNRAGALGDGLRGDVFICEAAGNLVKRLVLKERDGLPRAENAYKGTEFLRSTDERFRPVNLVQGPDGSLCVIDMYRGLIQHKTYVTPYLAKQVVQRRLETPLNLGRIYRVAGEGRPARACRPLSTATDGELVSLLQDPDGWWRDTAQRLLVERRAVGAIAAIREVFDHGPTDEARVQALYTLDGLGAITERDVRAALKAPSPRICCAGCRVAEAFVSQFEFGIALEDLTGSKDRGVRLQAAASLGAVPDPTQTLARVLARRDADKYLRGAAISGLAGREVAALKHLLILVPWPLSDGDRAALSELTNCALREDDEQRSQLADLIGSIASSDQRTGDLLAVVRGAQRIDSDDPRPLKLSREPTAWLEAAAGKNDLASALAESAVYLDWPGRPPVARRVKLRELTAAEIQQFARGQTLYAACIGCHQPDGTGSVGMAPPLAGSAIVQGPPERLARVLLHGMDGPYTMAEMEFTGVMVPAPFPSDGEVAAVMTFVRRSWGNTGDPVAADLVAQVRGANKDRAKPWTRAEIEEKK